MLQIGQRSMKRLCRQKVGKIAPELLDLGCWACARGHTGVPVQEVQLIGDRPLEWLAGIDIEVPDRIRPHLRAAS
ncbi:MAG TPA: hypothetical protein VIH92_08470, partial [Solirubrobacteraceae bacterium]